MIETSTSSGPAPAEARSPDILCRHCHCSQEHGCPGGCFWVLPDVCSACAIKQMVAAGRDPYALLHLQQQMREGNMQMRMDEDGPTMAETPISIMALLVCVADGWGALLARKAVAFAPEHMDTARNLSCATAAAVTAWNGAADVGIVASIEECAEIVRQGLAHGEPAAAPAASAPRLWRPGDPVI